MSDIKLKNLSVSIIGKTNTGKSTLLNQIIGHKISIVTPKVQTTRCSIMGVTTIKNCQLILFDTPGIFTANNPLERAMIKCAWSSLNNADIVALLIDNTKIIDETLKKIIEQLVSLKIKFITVLNKIDQKSKFSEENLIFCQNLKLRYSII
mgnify:CR=1 FL=1